MRVPLQQDTADRGLLPCNGPFKKSHTSFKKAKLRGSPGPGLSRHSPEQLYQPLLQVLLGSVQVIQVTASSGRSSPCLPPLAESVVIFLGLCGGSFKFLLGPRGVVGSPDHPLFPASPSPGLPPALISSPAALPAFVLGSPWHCSTHRVYIQTLSLQTSSHTPETLHTLLPPRQIQGTFGTGG